MSDEINLLDCPFCGTKHDNTLNAHGFGNFSVECYSCRATTSQKKGQDTAIKAWNTRAVTPTAATPRHDNAELVLRAKKWMNWADDGNPKEASLDSEYAIIRDLLAAMSNNAGRGVASNGN